MFSRTVLVVAVVLLVQPISAQAQLLKHRKQKDSPAPVVHVHNTTLQPIVTPAYNVEPVWAYQPTVPVFQAAYQPRVHHNYVAEAPVVTASIAAIEPAPANQIPIRTPALVTTRQSSGEIRLTNPRETGGTLYFTLNDVAYAINPGESKSVRMDRDWIIKFDNGTLKQMVYRLTGGAYEFTVSETLGWDLVKPESHAAPTNLIPHAASSIPAL